jgi:hypothetical protein
MCLPTLLPLPPLQPAATAAAVTAATAAITPRPTINREVQPPSDPRHQQQQQLPSRTSDR